MRQPLLETRQKMRIAWYFLVMSFNGVIPKSCFHANVVNVKSRQMILCEVSVPKAIKALIPDHDPHELDSCD
jgi:hypothetical protein